MRTCLITFLFTVGALLGHCPENVFEVATKQKYSEKEILLMALIDYESAGFTNAINFNEKAFGVLQIRKCVIDDVNFFYNTNYKHSDAFDYDKSIDIFWKYQRIWNNLNTPESYARIWNGGPSGMKKRATLKYWGEVKNRIEFFRKVSTYKVIQRKNDFRET